MGVMLVWDQHNCPGVKFVQIKLGNCLQTQQDYVKKSKCRLGSAFASGLPPTGAVEHLLIISVTIIIPCRCGSVLCVALVAVLQSKAAKFNRLMLGKYLQNHYIPIWEKQSLLYMFAPKTGF